MASIYDIISGFSSTTNYSKYNIVSGSNSNYYYSVINNNSGNNPVTASNLQTKWDGYILLNGNLIPNFFWKPSYQSDISFEPRIKKIQFGNGYQQRIPDGINTNLGSFNAAFDNRLESETVSILHFLNARNGQEGFIYNPPTVYSKINFNTRYVAPRWTVSYNSYNNYSIKVTLEEVVI